MMCFAHDLRGLDTNPKPNFHWDYAVIDLDDGRKCLSFKLTDVVYQNIKPGEGLTTKEAFEDYIENTRGYFDGPFLTVGPWPLWKDSKGKIYVLDGPKPYQE